MDATQRAALVRRTRHRLDAAGGLGNGIAAFVVFNFTGFFVPGAVNSDLYTSLTYRNLALLIPYLALTLLAGRFLIQHEGFRPLEKWLLEDRPATAAEQERALRMPRRWALRLAVPWALAVVVFTAINVSAGWAFASRVAVIVALGGITACALQYLLVERALRPVVALALAGGPPPPAAAPGVTARLTMAWTLAAGVPLLGISGVGVSALFGHGLTLERVAGACAALAAVGLAVGLLAIRLTSRSVGEPLRDLRDAFGDVEAGRLDATVDVDDGSEVGLLQSGFNRMVTGLREREQLREAFGTYVDPGLTQRVLSEGVDLAGEEVELSMFFLDVRDFTSFAEAASPESVVARLNELFELVVPIVVEHGGHANKFIGDGLLAIFGAPERLTDHADRAVDCADAIAAAVQARFGDALRVGIGVNTGTVVAGTVGGGGRLEFTVIGDAVNTAARVEAATRQTGDDVLVTEMTVRRLRSTTERWVPRPPMALKGKSEPVALYAPVKTTSGRAAPSSSSTSAMTVPSGANTPIIPVPSPGTATR